MNIAYIVLCHKDPELLFRLAESLRFCSDKLFVHVDKKVSIKPFMDLCGELNNVCFVKERVKNFFGGTTV